MGVKKGLNLAAAICSIVLGGILVIGAISSFSLLSAIGSEAGVDASMMGLVETILVFILLFSIAVVLVAIACVVKRNSDGKGIKIALLVLMLILAILEFAGSSIMWGIVCLVPVGLEIASLAIPEKTDPSVYNTSQSVFNYGYSVAATKVEPEAKNDTTISAKIAELKKLKDDNLITEEQYNNAVDELITKLK